MRPEVSVTSKVRQTLTLFAKVTAAWASGALRGARRPNAKEVAVLNPRDRPALAIRPHRVLRSPKAGGNLVFGRSVFPGRTVGKRGGEIEDADMYRLSQGARRKSESAPSLTRGMYGAGISR